MIDQLKVQDVLVIDLSSLQGELEVEARTVAIWILHPASFSQCFFELRVAACYNEYLLAVLKSVLALPFV